MAIDSEKWIMHGVDPSDPSCIHTMEELVDTVNRIGFLPLFRNMVPGFSVEEMTDPTCWWSHDPASDPWEWREEIAKCGQIAYGKFFGSKAGFISKEWFPIFANYRRDGYDFDALWDDEKASVKEKKIMDLFEESTELSSSEMKQKSGYRKNVGETNIDSILMHLQMQTYLIVSQFQKRTTKKGKAYGWSLAKYTMPEHLWGYQWVTSAYREEPEDSLEKIIDQVKKHFSDAEDRKIRSLVMIRKSEDKKSEPVKNHSAESTVKIAKPYPQNLIDAVFTETVKKYDADGNCTQVCTLIDDQIDPEKLNEDQIQGFLHTMTMLHDRERDVLISLFRDGTTHKAIAEPYGVCSSRIGQIRNKALRLLRHPCRKIWVAEGYEGHKQKLEEEKRRPKEVDLTPSPEYLKSIHIDNLDLTCRSHNCMMRSDCFTVWDIRELLRDEERFFQIRNLGKMSAEEIINAMLKKGYADEGLPAVKALRRYQSAHPHMSR